jgi:hypothetical protein
MSKSVMVRASSLSGLFDCPARWAAIHIDKIRQPSNGKATLGKAVHASTAAYDQSTLDGQGLTIEETKAAAVDAIHNPNEEVIWGEDEKPAEVEKIALALHEKYCTTIAPTQNYAAVEVACESLEITDLGITLTGTTDRIRVAEDGGYGIVDIKTGKTAVKASGIVETKGHCYQIGTYELLAEHASGLPITEPGQIVGLTTAKTDAAQRVGTGQVAGAREVLLGTEEMPGILQTASQIIHAGIFWGNPKSMLCHETYCPVYNRCNYRK